MERIDVITGTKLIEIQKKHSGITLYFQDHITDRLYVLTFKGLLFETSAPTIDKKVIHVHIMNTVGFQAISQLRSLKQDPSQYRQVFIRMENRTEDKSELLGVFKTYKLHHVSSAAIQKRV